MKRFLLAILLGVSLPVVFNHFYASKAHATQRSVVNIPASIAPDGIPTAYGFYANMDLATFNANVVSLSKERNLPFTKIYHALSPDKKKVIAIGLLFPKEAFMQIARQVAMENGGVLRCSKSQTLMCEVHDANRNEVLLLSDAFQSRTQDFGAILIANEVYMMPRQSKPKLLPGQMMAMAE